MLSPLLANILLDDLDRDLERRGHHFARYADDVLVLVGGTIPAADAVELRRIGVAEIFTSGTPTARVVAFIEAHAPRRDLEPG